jgi:hypothetical protein
MTQGTLRRVVRQLDTIDEREQKSSVGFAFVPGANRAFCGGKKKGHGQ